MRSFAQKKKIVKHFVKNHLSAGKKTLLIIGLNRTYEYVTEPLWVSIARFKKLVNGLDFKFAQGLILYSVCMLLLMHESKRANVNNSSCYHSLVLFCVE